MNKYYLKRGDSITGPYASSELIEASRRGGINPDDEVSISSEGPWKLASIVKQLSVHDGPPVDESLDIQTHPAALMSFETFSFKAMLIGLINSVGPRRRVSLILLVVLWLFILMFPPFEETYHNVRSDITTTDFVGHYFLFLPPSRSKRRRTFHRIYPSGNVHLGNRSYRAVYYFCCCA